MSDQPIRNVFLTDENVYGPAVDFARKARNVQLVRDIDIDVACDHDDYDLCLFYYAIENRYVLVTGNVKDFEHRFYEYISQHDDHPGIVLIRENHNRSTQLIADWLAIWADEDLSNAPWYI